MQAFALRTTLSTQVDSAMLKYHGKAQLCKEWREDGLETWNGGKAQVLRLTAPMVKYQKRHSCVRNGGRTAYKPAG